LRQFAMLRAMPRQFLIDTDTASDDAVALIMALRSPGIEVVAITTVAGNVNVQQATRNALYTAELCGSQVAVFRGADKPLRREHIGADWFHGRDGLGDHGYPAPRRAAEKMNAVDAIIEVVAEHPGIEIVTLGPLTNIALALQKNPALATKVSRCIVMGGAPCCEGNVTPAAEYNIWCDPEAASIVARSGLPIELVGWHLCRGDAVVNPLDIVNILGFGTPVAKFAIECNSRGQEAFLEQTGEDGISLPDPVAMAIAVDPSIVTSQSMHFLEVETQSDLTLGMTVVDRLNVAHNARNNAVWSAALAGGHRAKVIWTIDNARWKQALYTALR
jgi:inosine-uridine nucleoside N-ribohydrolase